MLDEAPLSSQAKTILGANLPPRVNTEDELCLWSPSRAALERLLYCFQKLPLVFLAEPELNFCRLQLDPTHLANLFGLLAQHLSDRELRQIKALAIPSHGAPQPQDFARVTTLEQVIKLHNSAWLLDLLAGGSITNHFQPIVFSQDLSQIFALESLMRGISREGDLISPRQVFGVAEDLDLLCQVDLVSRQNTIAALQRWESNGKMFINFLPTCLEDPNFCLHCTIADIDEANIPHERIIFEITEVERVKDIQRFRRLLDLYRDIGFQIALDDLGSGYSSLNMLHQLRPDYIKLDLELMRNVHQDPYKSLIAAKLLEVAHSLNIPTIAEGIETPGELDWVQAHGATYVQGYLIGKPAPMSAQFSLLAKHKLLRQQDLSPEYPLV
ncbi:MAG: EAL domain-containing protein [Pseudanabaenaceae cyanobacterium bins.68]|nr:EAL domain-containing protein [Pseudanabaenaceae cyanobacterium bins.68]